MPNARLLALLLSLVSLVAPSTARAESLFDLQKYATKILSCEPKVLHDDSILTIRMPERHGDFLVIDEPKRGHPVHVVYPRPRWPLMLTAAKFRTLSTVSWKVSDIWGVFYAVEPAFWVTGRHTIFVGSGFDTPNPIIDGLCEVEYVEAVPPRPYNSQSPGPYREGEAWNNEMHAVDRHAQYDTYDQHALSARSILGGLPGRKLRRKKQTFPLSCNGTPSC